MAGALSATVVGACRGPQAGTSARAGRGAAGACRHSARGWWCVCIDRVGAPRGAQPADRSAGRAARTVERSNRCAYHRRMLISRWTRPTRRRVYTRVHDFVVDKAAVLVDYILVEASTRTAQAITLGDWLFNYRCHSLLLPIVYETRTLARNHAPLILPKKRKAFQKKIKKNNK